MKFTDEQMAIINAQGNLKVNAVAGSGKTSTLVEYCVQRPDQKILYLVFNRSAKLDAERKFKKAKVKNVDIHTAHSLAYRAIVPVNDYKVTNHMSVDDVKKILQLNKIGLIEGYIMSKHIVDYLEVYLNSTEVKIINVDYASGLSQEAKDYYDDHRDVIQQGVGELLKRMDSGHIDITHGFYLKKYQMSDPKLNYDCILYDEFQDSNPVMIDVFLKQECTKVCVGDTHQQIYAWRGAVNAFDHVDFDELFLTKSFRFNQDIADTAIKTLELKKIFDEDFESVTITGLADTDNEIKTKAILARKNISLLKKAIEMIVNKKVDSIYFEGGYNNYTFMSGINIYDVYNLFYNYYNYIRNPMLKSMDSFQDLLEYSEKTDDKNIKMLIDIVREYGRKLPDYFKQLKKMQVDDKDKYKADVIFSTIHKSKGLEYDEVELCQDFITKEDIKNLIYTGKLIYSRTNEDVNILYVAKTRAKKKLIYNEPVKLYERSTDG